MKKILILGLVLFYNQLQAQSPLVKEWDYRYGGLDFEWFTCFQKTSDGGYILGGVSYSGIGGDKSQSLLGGSDYWIVKTDALGNKQWDRSYGGLDYDELWTLRQTSDG